MGCGDWPSTSPAISLRPPFASARLQHRRPQPSRLSWPSTPPTNRPPPTRQNGEFYATFHRHNAFRENGHRKGRNTAAIHEASVSVGYPEDDHFQRFISLQEADLRISPLYPDLQKPRSEHVLMIEALLSSRTGEDRKRSLLAAIVTRLQAAGTDPNDVMGPSRTSPNESAGESSSARSTVPVVPLVAAVPPCLSRCGQKSKVARGRVGSVGIAAGCTRGTQVPGPTISCSRGSCGTLAIPRLSNRFRPTPT